MSIRIIHSGDIHMPMIARLSEYRDILPNVIKLFKMQKPDLICLVGDLVHNKNILSPEQVVEMLKFFINVANIAPTVVIAGNHDLNLQSSNRIDVISALLSSNLELQKLPFYYDLHTRTYDFKELGVAITAVSVLDNKIPTTIIKDRTNICLYHGLIRGAKTDSGYVFDEKHGSSIMVSDFGAYDIVMLGDIHKYQTFRKNKTMAYCGSLIQQNHGEDIQKGFLVWNADDLSHKFMKVPNPYTYNTLLFDKSLCPIKPYPPKKCHLRVFFSLPRNSVNNNDRKEIENVVRKEFEPLSLVYAYQTTSTKLGEGFDADVQIMNVKDQNVQQELIVKWCKNLNYEQSHIDELLKFDNEIFEECALKRIDSKCSDWRLLQLHIVNFLSHKDTNIDFTNYHGITGIFGNNKSGKSVVVDAILYAIFGKTSRTSSIAELKNFSVSDNWFFIVLDLSIDGNNYRIERKSKINDDGTSKNSLNYWFESDGEWVKENKDSKIKTEKELKRVFGDYDDFVMSVVSTQSGINQFVDLTPAPRAKLILNHLGFDVFEVKRDICSKRRSRVYGIRCGIDVDGAHTMIDNCKIAIVEEEKQKIKIEEIIIQHKKSLKKLRARINEITKKITNIGVISETEEDLQQSISDLYEKAESIKERYIKVTYELEQFENIQEEELPDIKKIKTKLDEKERLFENLKKENNACEKEITRYEEFVNFACPTNDDNRSTVCPFVIRTNDAISIVRKNEQEIVRLNKEINNYRNDIVKLKKQIDDIKDKQLTNAQNSKQIAIFDGILSDCNQQIDTIALSINILNIKLKTLRENKEIIEQNKVLLVEKSRLDFKEISIEKQLDEYVSEFTDICVNIGSWQSDIKNYEKIIQQASDLDKQLLILTDYEAMMHREGIPLTLLEKYIPIINSNINAILASLTNYVVTIYLDDRRDLQIGFGEDEDNNDFVSIGLASGMEKTIIAMAIRIVLTLISNLSHPQLWIIDEGFGVLDHEHRDKISNLFNILRELFSTILIITHIEFIKDLVDNQIIAIKENRITKMEVLRGPKK